MSWPGWIAVAGIALVIGGGLVAMDMGSDYASPAARRFAGNVGCLAILLGLILIVAAIAWRVFS